MCCRARPPPCSALTATPLSLPATHPPQLRLHTFLPVQAACLALLLSSLPGPCQALGVAPASEPGHRAGVCSPPVPLLLLPAGPQLLAWAAPGAGLARLRAPACGYRCMLAASLPSSTCTHAHAALAALPTPATQAACPPTSAVPAAQCCWLWAGCCPLLRWHTPRRARGGASWRRATCWACRRRPEHAPPPCREQKEQHRGACARRCPLQDASVSQPVVYRPPRRIAASAAAAVSHVQLVCLYPSYRSAASAAYLSPSLHPCAFSFQTRLFHTSLPFCRKPCSLDTTPTPPPTHPPTHTRTDPKPHSPHAHANRSSLAP